MATRGSWLQKQRWTRMLCFAGSLLFLLAVLNGAWPLKAAGAGVLLAETHKTKGVTCVQCHKDKPSSPVPTAVCVSCHGDMTKSKATAAKKRNPHDAHIPFPDCDSCHHVHKPSENQCGACHDFDFKTP
jgi:hypothetical protein